MFLDVRSLLTMNFLGGRGSLFNDAFSYASSDSMMDELLIVKDLERSHVRLFVVLSERLV
jgi:hypothetical protein